MTGQVRTLGEELRAHPRHVSYRLPPDPFVQPVRRVDPDPEHRHCDDVWTRAERLGNALAFIAVGGFVLAFGPSLIRMVVDLVVRP